MEKNEKNNGMNMNTNSAADSNNSMAKNEAAKNFLWRMWDFAKYHKDVAEGKTNESDNVYCVLECAVNDAYSMVLVTATEGFLKPSGLPLGDNGELFRHLLGTTGLNAVERNRLTGFDVVEWYNLGKDALAKIMDTKYTADICADTGTSRGRIEALTATGIAKLYKDVEGNEMLCIDTDLFVDEFDSIESTGIVDDCRENDIAMFWIGWNDQLDYINY